MATAFDVARYILEQKGTLSAMKLQKLVYYSQAWHAVWDDKPLFQDRIEAWANGPVVPELYKAHRGEFQVSEDMFKSGGSARLAPNEKKSIDVVLDFYGDKSPHWLSLLTHQESPWKDAREGLEPGERGTREITLASMAEYYGSLQ